MKKQGMFIVLEGPDGIGKSTTIDDLANHISQNKTNLTHLIQEQFSDIVVTHEPGATELGVKLRELMLESDTPISDKAKLYLFLADRAQHMHDIIIPAIKQNKLVICDRFMLSTIAYQFPFTKEQLRNFNGLDLETESKMYAFIQEINHALIDDPANQTAYTYLPDIQFVMQADLDTAYQRLQNRTHQDNNDKQVNTKVKLQKLLNRYRYLDAFNDSSPYELQNELININANDSRNQRVQLIEKSILNYLKKDDIK